MITLNRFSIGYGPRTLIADTDLTVPSGSLVALIGRNGAGKSTLLRALAGLGVTYSGQIHIRGNELRSITPRARARLISLVTTERTRIPSLRCSHIVAMGRAPHTSWTGQMQPSDLRAVGDALSLTSMQGFADRTMDHMSDGECQRIMVARAIAQDTPVMLLDEPTSFLDLPARYELCSLLRTLAHDKGKTIIFSTHELDIALSMADRIMLIDPPTLTIADTKDMAASHRIQSLFALDKWKNTP